MSKVLIVEDEENLSRFIELELKHENYDTVDVSANGREGLELALENDYDAILLDLMLPDLNGLEVCRRVRQEKTTPIIIMTARDSVMDRVSGLDYGADDYLVKPFTIEELLARLRAILRRVNLMKDSSLSEKNVHSNILKIKDIEVAVDDQVVKKNGELIKLTKREYDLLLFLIQNVNKMQSRENIMRHVWKIEDDIEETNVVDVYIRYLRNKIDTPGSKSIIHTLRGRGYIIRK